jgi:hypothetical protein
VLKSLNSVDASTASIARISIKSVSLYSRVILGELPRAAEYLLACPFSCKRFSLSSM